MGCIGHKGAMGWPGTNPPPQWIIDIIQFRNEKYSNDLDKALDEERPVEDVENEYDKIDQALCQLSRLNDTSVKIDGYSDVSGIGGCPTGEKEVQNA